MLKRERIVLLGISLFVASFLSFLPVQAQVDPRDRVIPYLYLEKMDVRDAIKTLFKDVDLPYRIDANVLGTVTLRATNQPFETVLRNILNQVGATYRIREGAYEIVMPTLERPAPSLPTEGQPTVPPTGTMTRRIDLQSADPYLILTLLTTSYTSLVIENPEITTVPVGAITITAPKTGGGGGGGGGGGY
jgi:type II secretory pathway component GspD/PulD (secretin)